jgi:fructose-1,6-bisphosphatase/inositol monophosphatase family enzyme
MRDLLQLAIGRRALAAIFCAVISKAIIPSPVKGGQSGDDCRHRDRYFTEIHPAKGLPDYGWLSEERADSPERLSRSRVWIVDPLDGTKEFIAGRPEFVVSIGLADNGQPTLGVLFNPITDELFSAVCGHGAFLNGRRIYCTRTESLPAAHLIVSRTETAAGLWQAHLHQFKSIAPYGSVAYKLAKVAAGYADLHISLNPKTNGMSAPHTACLTKPEEC